MRSKDIWIALILVLALGIGGFVAANANGLLSSRPSAVAVVNVLSVFESLKEKLQVEANLQSRAEGVKLDMQDRKRMLEELKSDLDILAPDTPAYNEKQAKLEQNFIESTAWGNFQNQKIAQEQVIQYERLYQKMMEAIGTIGRENGYDLVLFKEKPVNFRGAKPETIPRIIQSRKVLWSGDNLDLTDEVIQRMNNQYSNRAQ